MNVAVQGTKEVSNYNTFLRAMGVVLSDLSDKNFNIYAVGPASINSYTAEFCNVSEKSLKQRGIKIKYYRVPASFVEENHDNFNYFAFFSNPNQKPSALAHKMEMYGVETGIFRY